MPATDPTSNSIAATLAAFVADTPDDAIPAEVADVQLSGRVFPNIPV